MRKEEQLRVTLGAAVIALLLWAGIASVNVYGGEFITDAVLEDIEETEDLGDDIFSDGNGLDSNEDKGDNSDINTDGNRTGNAGVSGNSGITGGGHGGGYSSGGSGGASETVLHQPKLMFESCNLSGTDLPAGSEHTLEAVFSNKSKKERIYNLKVILSLDGKDIYLSDKSFYFGSVEAGGKITLTSALTIAPNAEEGLFPLTASFEYEDKKGNAYTGAESLELRAVQPSEVVFECGDIPAGAAATDTLILTFKAQNLSRTTVHNVRISLEGQGLFPKEEVFVGNMDAGTQGEGVMRVYVGTRTMKEPGVDEGTSESEMYGKTNGTLTLVYEDSMGNTHEDVKEFKIEITKPKIQSLKVEKPKEANSWWFSVIAVAGAGMLAVIMLLLGRIHRQNVRLEEMKKTYTRSV